MNQVRLLAAYLATCLVYDSQSVAADDMQPDAARLSNAGPEAPLHFDEVAASVTAHDPRIWQAVQEVERARGEHLSARGAFDPTLRGTGSLLTGAYYDTRRADVELSQPTTLWGSELFVGYRLGLERNDRWPTYYSDQTLSQGEVRAGARLPVWRDGLIDEERARRARTEREVEVARQGLAGRELALEIGAAQAYWRWVAAGQRRLVAEALVKLAEDRDEQLRRRLAAGSIAEFDVLDNQRILLERRDLLVTASRGLEQAAFELGLFLRDDTGNSVIPTPARLPVEPERTTPPELAMQAAVERVLQCHPEVEGLRADLEAAEIDLKLARNQLAPELDLTFQVSRDLGDPTGTTFDVTLPGTVFEAGVNLRMPFLFREERGKARSARAKLAAVRADIQLIEDQLRLRTNDIASAVRAAQQRVDLMTAVVDTAAELASGERRRFEAGATNLIFVNLREQTAAAARIGLAQAVAAAEIERVRWRVTTNLNGCNSVS